MAVQGVFTILFVVLPLILIARSYFVIKSKNFISKYDIQRGKYCFNCGEMVLSDEEYYRNWANYISTTGNLDYQNNKSCLCKSCERENKLSLLSGRIPFNKIVLKRFLIDNDKKLTLGVISFSFVLFTTQIVCILTGYHIPLIDSMINMYLVCYWIFMIYKDYAFEYKR